MKTLNQIAESVMIGLKQVTDESYLSGKEEWIKGKIMDMRATLAREEFRSDLYINAEFYTKLDLAITCETKSVSLGKVTITSEVELPKVVLPTLLSGISGTIKYFGDDNILTPGFSLVSLSGLNSSDAAEYTSMKPIGAHIGTNLYLKNMPKGMSNITAVVLLNDPTDNPNYSEDDGYPVPSNYKIELLVKKDILSGWNIPLDVLHNEKDDSIPTAPSLTAQDGNN